MFERTLRKLAILVATAMLAALALGSVAAQEEIVIDFYFPEATANNAQAIFEEYAAQFKELYPNITINVAYQGAYADLRTKVQTEVAAGAGPDVAVMLTTDLFSFIEDDSIVRIQDLVDQMEDGEAFVENFFPAFLTNALDEEGALWSVPFQRSTPVLYYNKDLFREVGLDPEVAPRNETELIEFAKTLTTPDRWGVWVPSDGFPIWLFTSEAIAEGQNLTDADPCKVSFNTEAVQKGLNDWLALSSEHAVMPSGLLSWGDAPSLFTAGSTAMIVHTTGSLTRILNEATFEVGVGFVPFGPANEEGVGYGVPTGGGNMYIFKNSTPEEQEAAWLWIQFLASDAIQADWGSRTGYVAATKGAWDVEPLASLVTEKPQYLVARDQLAYAQKEFAAFRTIDLQNIINKTLGDVLSGAVPNDGVALSTAQEQLDSLLADFCQ